jgi:hypothetical protein
MRIGGLTQSILAKAFRGELVSTEAELAERDGRTYESAGQLLQRIRTIHEKTDSFTKSPRMSRRRHAG